MSSRAKPEKSQSESVRLPANFLSVLFALRLPFCLPLFLSRLQKSLCFQWLQSCFCLPFCLPVSSFASILESYGAQSQNQVQNLFFACCLLFVCYFACWSQTRLHFNQLWYKAFGTHFVCYFVCWSQLSSRKIPNLRDEYPALRQLWRTILPPAPNPVCSKQPLFCIVCRIYFYPYIYRTLPVFMTYFANFVVKSIVQEHLFTIMFITAGNVNKNRFQKFLNRFVNRC